MSKKPYIVGTKAPKLKVLIYGDPGVGKTYLAATAQAHPDMAEVLFLNVDHGVETVAGTGALAVDLGGLGSPVMKDAEEVLWSIIKKEPGYDKVKTVVLDNVTELQGVDITDIVRESKAGKRKERSIDDIGQDDYGKSTTRLLRVLRLLRDADVNVIIIAWTKKIQPEGADKPTSVLPSLTQKAGQVCQGLVSCVWYMFIDGEGKHKVLTQPTNIFAAKTRIPAFADAIGKVIENPDLSKIYDILQKSTQATKAA